jgi:hypothetical protein
VRNRRITFFALAIACLQGLGAAQTAVTPSDPAPVQPANKPSAQPIYIRPTQTVLFRTYAFDTMGPYPLFTSLASASIHQATDNPPEWSQGFDGLARRFGSSYGIAFVETTARYSLAEAIGEDTLYYPCRCKGVFPRLRHAVVSSFTGRRGADGHRVFSSPSVAAPYVGAFTATYGWYPKRYGAKAALRMGDNGFLSYIGGNIALEFLYGGPHSLLSRVHLPIPTGAANPGSTQ